ncbi:unnamed protein product [Brassicogethes aeneus]|uniref:HSF-type DNA-binding domain-containing protein n=1 Tax=Brassicogethes aeneus TaxID=1431903 RepID=A0A9P0FIX7_BRAAE|nr:unnamed protein product [Brassicogethes aeneus]
MATEKGAKQITKNIKKESQPGDVNGMGVPLFLKKLWKILYDEDSENIIEWSPLGDAFIIYDQIQFMMVLLPKYFKHNNLASFVRQLNMYGFHKRQHSEKDGEMEFNHPYFMKDLPELLKFISRKAPVHRNQQNSKDVAEPYELDAIFKSIKIMKNKQNLVDNELKSLKQENGALWSELNNLRVKHAKQTQIINKLIHFLVHYMHSSSVQKRQGSRITKESKSQTLNKRPGFFELEYNKNNPVKKKKSNSKDEGPTIFELEHNDCPNEYWKKYDEKMLFVDPPGQHIVTEPDEDSSESESLNPNINEITETPNLTYSNIIQEMADNEDLLKEVSPSEVLDQPSTSKSIPNITEKTSITLDKALSSKENFNLFLDSTQTELNNFQETLSGLSQNDIAQLLDLFESNVPLPIEASEVNDPEVVLTLAGLPKTDPKVTINPDDMLNLTNEIDKIQGENNLIQNFNLGDNRDLNMTSMDYLQNDNSVTEENVDLDILNLLGTESNDG